MKATFKKFRVPVVITIIWLAIVSYNVAVAQGVIEAGGEECPGHWHAGYSVWVEDNQLGFSERGPGGDAGRSPAGGFHIHGNDGTLHFHPGTERCIPIGDALEKLGVTVSSDTLTIDETQHVAGGTYAENATYDVVVYHKAWGGDWKEVSNVGSFMDKQLGNGDQIMVSYHAADSPVTIEDRQAQTKSLAGGNYEPVEQDGVDDGVFIGITMATIFAIIAIVIWYNVASKTW